MKTISAGTGYGRHMRAHVPRPHRKAEGVRHHAARVHTKRVKDKVVFHMPDEQMSEPPVVPKDERKYWH